jgi:hypothetical protein
MVRKIDLHIKNITPLIRGYMKANDVTDLQKYLLENSNLPGRRANLELASAFVQIIKDQTDFTKSFELCKYFLEYDNKKAPTNDPREFLPFCGIWALGCMESEDEFHEETKNLIFEAAHDARWRIREAVAKSIHCMIKNNIGFIEIMVSWIDNNDWLAFRAVAAGFANPSLLKDPIIAKQALDIHWMIFRQIIECTDQNELNSEEFRIMIKGLNYTLSVVVAAAPNEGFQLLEDILRKQSSNQNTLNKIIHENLKKNRLIKNYPAEVENLKALIF